MQLSRRKRRTAFIRVQSRRVESSSTHHEKEAAEDEHEEEVGRLASVVRLLEVAAVSVREEYVEEKVEAELAKVAEVGEHSPYLSRCIVVVGFLSLFMFLLLLLLWMFVLRCWICVYVLESS